VLLLLQVIDGEGMPHAGNPYVKGRLFVLFKVAFPDTITEAEMKGLLSILPQRPAPALTGEVRYTTMLFVHTCILCCTTAAVR
jgi:DnaJ-class molecular chaperone